MDSTNTNSTNVSNTINETAIAGGNDKEEMDTDEPNEMINMEEDDNNTGALDSSIIQFIPPKSDWDIGTNYIEKSTVNDINKNINTADAKSNSIAYHTLYANFIKYMLNKNIKINYNYSEYTKKYSVNINIVDEQYMMKIYVNKEGISNRFQHMYPSGLLIKLPMAEPRKTIKYFDYQTNAALASDLVPAIYDYSGNINVWWVAHKKCTDSTYVPIGCNIIVQNRFLKIVQCTGYQLCLNEACTKYKISFHKLKIKRTASTVVNTKACSHCKVKMIAIACNFLAFEYTNPAITKDNNFCVFAGRYGQHQEKCEKIILHPPTSQLAFYKRSKHTQDNANAEALECRFHDTPNGKKVQYQQLPGNYFKDKKRLLVIQKRDNRNNMVNNGVTNYKSKGFGVFKGETPKVLKGWLAYKEIGHPLNEIIVIMKPEYGDQLCIEFKMKNLQIFQDVCMMKNILKEKPQLLDRYTPQIHSIDATNDKFTNKQYKIIDVITWFTIVKKNLASMYTLCKREKTESYLTTFGCLLEPIYFDVSQKYDRDKIELMAQNKNSEEMVKVYMVRTLFVSDLDQSIRNGALLTIQLMRTGEWFKWKRIGIIKMFYSKSENEILRIQQQALQWLDSQGLKQNVVPDKIHSMKQFKYLSKGVPEHKKDEWLFDAYELRNCNDPMAGKEKYKSWLKKWHKEPYWKGKMNMFFRKHIIKLLLPFMDKDTKDELLKFNAWPDSNGVESNHRDIKCCTQKRVSLYEMAIVLKGQMEKQYGKTFDNALLETELLPNLREIKFLRVMKQLDKRTNSTGFQGRLDKYNMNVELKSSNSRGLNYLNDINQLCTNDSDGKRIPNTPIFTSLINKQKICNVIYHGSLHNQNYIYSDIYKLIIFAIEFNNNKK
eukprot:430800_1